MRIKKNTSLDKCNKFEFYVSDNIKFEAAYFYIQGRERPHIACVSTQIGCKMGCLFCATHQECYLRNLTTNEILLQINTIFSPLISSGLSADSFEISFMGMGEPLNNMKNVIESITKSQKLYPQLSRVTISTAGAVKKIEKLLTFESITPMIHLQLSLHATNNLRRKELIPGSNDNIDDLLQVCQKYYEKTGDKVCLNYILLGGINDNEYDIDYLCSLDKNCFYLKLTQLNPTNNMPYFLKKVPISKSIHIAQRLSLFGLKCKIFTGDGLDINASCGQMSASPKELNFPKYNYAETKSLSYAK